MRTIAGVLLLAALAPTAGSQPPTGAWRASLTSRGGELPFGLDITSNEGALRAAIRNGKETIAVDVRTQDAGGLRLEFPHYDSAIEASLVEGELRGVWRKQLGAGVVSELAFRATHGDAPRFQRLAATGPVPTLPTRWAVDFEKDEQPAVLLIEEQSDDGSIHATFLTALGDYRYLEGCGDLYGLRLSCFDGAHAFLFVARLGDDGSLNGDFWSSDSWHETWTARPDPDAGLGAAVALTQWQATADQPFGGLAFPDLEGVRRRLDEPAFAGKARLLVALGSWCPNCHDEAAYLVELDRRFRARGLSILGLAFERSADPQVARRQVRRFVERHGVRFPILIAGLADKEKASQALPLLDRIRAYPTTVFLHGDGRVDAVHTGYSGPATGAAHQALRAGFEARIEALLGPPPTYTGRTSLGWSLHVADALLADNALADRVFAELDSQLHQISRAVPAAALTELRQVPIWIEREQAGTACMAYHPSAAWLRDHGYDERKARSVEIGNAEAFLSWTHAQPWMVLHELAHAYHDRHLGFDHADVHAAFEQARAAGTYETILHINGQRQRHYALTDHKEYFAEASEAFFGTNDMFPFVRAELEAHDPVLHALLQRLWKVAP